MQVTHANLKNHDSNMWGKRLVKDAILKQEGGEMWQRLQQGELDVKPAHLLRRCGRADRTKVERKQCANNDVKN